MSANPRPPLWLPPVIAAGRLLPFGRYWLLHRLRRFVRRSFVAHLAPDLGSVQFHCDLRDSVAAEACFTGWYEPQETQVFVHVLRPGDVCVDVGANWGYFSLVAAGLVGAAGRVVALEPERRLFERLSSNVAMNLLRTVRPLQLAAGAGPGSMAFASFDAEGDNWGTSHVVGATAAADFHCATASLDDVLDAEGVDGVQLVKIDVEGQKSVSWRECIAGLPAAAIGTCCSNVIRSCSHPVASTRGCAWIAWPKRDTGPGSSITPLACTRAPPGLACNSPR